MMQSNVLKILKRIGMKSYSVLSGKVSFFFNASRLHPFVFLLRLPMTVRVKHRELEEWQRPEKNLSQYTLSTTVAWYPFTTKLHRSSLTVLNYYRIKGHEYNLTFCFFSIQWKYQTLNVKLVVLPTCITAYFSTEKLF